MDKLEYILYLYEWFYTCKNDSSLFGVDYGLRIHRSLVIYTYFLMVLMMIAPRYDPTTIEKKNMGKVKRKYGRIWGEEEGDADYTGELFDLVSKDFTLYEKGFSNEGIGLERFENSSSVWAGIPLRRYTEKVTQKAWPA